MIYLASPYSHPSPEVRERRYQEASRVAAALLRKGHMVFCPVAYSHPLLAQGLPSSWEFWEGFDRHMLALADDLFVLMLDGWQESVGVAAEIEIARSLHKPVIYITKQSAGI